MPVFNATYMVNFDNRAGKDKIGLTVGFRVDTGKPEKIWELPIGGRAHNCAIVDGHLYYGQAAKKHSPTANNAAKLACVELATGKVVGTVDLKDVGGGQFDSYSCVSAMNGHLVARVKGSKEGRAIMIKADPGDFRILGKVANNITWAGCLSAAVADGFLYTRGGQSVFCYDLRKR
jgi:hypothetical protein